MKRLCCLAAAVLLCGCGQKKVSETKPESPKPLALAELLKKSRAELATLEKECADKIALEVKDFEADPSSRERSVIRFPLVTPIWQEAQFSEQAGLSLPGYLKPNTKDNALAWHLARHGDLDAARRLAEPGEIEALSKLHRSLYERNYPLEWTRLIARQIQLAQLRLRHGELDAPEQIITIHKELQQILDAKAHSSPLGATLLPLGRRSLREAPAGWKAAEKIGPVDLVEKALADWGEVPMPSPALHVGMNRSLVEGLWGCKREGSVLVARNVVRALDSSALPLPCSGADAVLACFDAENKLREVAILYRPRLNLSLPRASDHAHHFEEHSLAVAHEEEKAGLRRAVYSLGEQRLVVTLCVSNGRLGGIVRLRAATETKVAAPLGRDFGIVHLDATFEHNRLRCAPKQLGDSVTFFETEALAGLHLPVAGFRPMEATLTRDKSTITTRRLLVRGEADTSLSQLLAGPLIGSHGFGTVLGEAIAEGRRLSFVWEDGKTRYALRLPNSAQLPYEFEAVSLRSRETRPDTPATVDELRRQRLAAGKPWKSLPRSLVLERVKLGMSREAAEKALPRAEKLPFGLRQTFKPRQITATTFAPRQLIVRIAGGRVAEIRLLLLELNRGGQQALFAGLQEKYGVKKPLPARWASAWRGVIERAETASLHFWQDDLTLMTYERLGGVAEWVVRDRPPEQEGGIALEPLRFCSRGVEGCCLGASRASILRDWKGTTAKDTAAEVLTLFPPEGGRHDAVLVWFKDDKAVRIVARHVLAKGSSLRMGELSKALNTAWGEILKTVGWWSQRGSRDGVTRFLGWLDDQTRLRLFWNDEDGSPRVFSEWVNVPPSGPLP